MVRYGNYAINSLIPKNVINIKKYLIYMKIILGTMTINYDYVSNENSILDNQNIIQKYIDRVEDPILDIAKGLEKELGGTVVPVSRPGGGGAVGYKYIQSRPASGYDIVWNSNPVAGSVVGWICILTGTPGEWKSFGNISQ